MKKLKSGRRFTSYYHVDKTYLQSASFAPFSHHPRRVRNGFDKTLRIPTESGRILKILFLFYLPTTVVDHAEEDSSHHFTRADVDPDADGARGTNLSSLMGTFPPKAVPSESCERMGMAASRF